MAHTTSVDDRDALALELCDWIGAMDQADAMMAELAAYAAAWDAHVAERRSDVEAWDDLIARADRGELDARPYSPAPAPTPVVTPTFVPTRARDKAWRHLASGVRVVRAGDVALVPSSTRGGVVHRVQDGVCSCEAGAHGKPCWHAAAVELSAASAAAHAA